MNDRTPAARRPALEPAEGPTLPTVGDTCEPIDAPPHPFLAPVIARDPEGKGRTAWRVTCAGVDPFSCSMFGPTRKSLVERLSVCVWVRDATMWAERAGTLRIAPPPPSACHDWHREAIVTVGAGLYHYCTMPIAQGLGGPEVLARLRTGFSPERVVEAGRWCGREWETWVAALGQAKADLLAGALTEEETTHLSPDPACAGYLRLDGVGQSVTLGCLESLTGVRLRDFYLAPGDWSRERTCWA